MIRALEHSHDFKVHGQPMVPKTLQYACCSTACLTFGAMWLATDSWMGMTQDSQSCSVLLPRPWT